MGASSREGSQFSALGSEGGEGWGEGVPWRRSRLNLSFPFQLRDNNPKCHSSTQNPGMSPTQLTAAGFWLPEPPLWFSECQESPGNECAEQPEPRQAALP